jgi:aldehyde:ferredoxin oxidoreductase
VINIERLFLVKAGFTRKDNSLPKRLTDEPMPEGPSIGHVCHLEEMLDDYYAIRGWIAEGVPTPEHLAKLDISG